MVRTWGQLKAQQYFGESSAASSDSEVSFNPHWLDTVLLGRRPNTVDLSDEDNPHHTYTMAADRQERRIQLLESAVMGMTEKFDELLSVVNPDTARRASMDAGRSVPPVPNMAPGRHCDEARPAVLDARAPGCADFVTQQLRREEFAVPRLDEGKSMAPDPFVKELLAKPYMYISRPGFSTMRKKLDVLETMTFHEYVIAFIKMVRDPRAQLQDQMEVHLEHLQQVVEDAAVRDWSSVRPGPSRPLMQWRMVHSTGPTGTPCSLTECTMLFLQQKLPKPNMAHKTAHKVNEGTSPVETITHPKVVVSRAPTLVGM